MSINKAEKEKQKKSTKSQIKNGKRARKYRKTT